MVLCGDTSNIQIFAGTANTIKPFNEWINILDPNLNLHLKQPMTTEAWVAKHPSKNDPITSVELYTEWGKRIVSFFGARKEGDNELTAWSELTGELK
ncbi:MAG: hypothetical protein MK132_18460 [Lentisphaerales bacterium]|nr:hypothetical protein [Lentisphaerales bacterium]